MEDINANLKQSDMELPIVSIIMATYNREQFILEALDSIKEQTFQNWECLIIDDGGKDNTGEVIFSLLQDDHRFRYLKRSSGHKKGLPGCRNYGLGIARGSYIIFFDDDDIVHPQNLEICLQAFKRNKIDFCAYRKQPFFDFKDLIGRERQELLEGRRVNKNDMEQILKNYIPLASCTVMWKKENFTDEFYNENLMYAEEWECYSRIISNGKLGIVINNVLYFNRKHPKSNTGEFWKGSKIRVQSKKNAVKLVLENLKNKNLLTPGLAKFFIRLGFSLNDQTIIFKTLNYSGASRGEKIKYFFGFHFYFIIKPIFNLRKNLLKI